MTRFDATLKKRTDRRNRRHDFPELKFVQDGGFTGGIETNLCTFSARVRKKNESLRSVHRETKEIPRNRPKTRAQNSTLSKRRDPATKRGGRCSIASDLPAREFDPAFSSGRGALRPPARALGVCNSNPILSPFIYTSSSIIEMPFDLTTSNPLLSTRRKKRLFRDRQKQNLAHHQNAHLFLRKETLEQFRERDPHGVVCVCF